MPILHQLNQLKPSIACPNTSSPTGTSGNKRRYNPYNITPMPPIPTIPKPGMTNISRRSNDRPDIMNIVQHCASCAI